MIRDRMFRTIVVFSLLATVPRLALAGPEEKYYQAFYLETEKGDCAAAIKLYEDVAGSSADKDIKAQAKARLEGCREELASTDLAKLMPPGAFAYLELNQPGAQLSRLAKRLGLLAGPEPVPAGAGKRLAISPALIDAAIGIRGAAVAITGFNPLKGQPSGVLVLNPGRHEVIRGIIETGLPVGAKSVESISGFATFDVEGQALITLTSRLVIVSNDRKQIEGVIARLNGTDSASLAKDPALAADLKNRDDSLLLFFVNAKAMMPMLKPMIGMGAVMNPQVAMIQGVLDPENLRSFSGRIGVVDDGLVLDLAMRLEENHHNLVYNFLRTPAINRETVKSIPQGAAAVVVGALNEAESRYSGGASDKAGKTPIVTALDLGREVFANITSFALFVLPPGDGSEGGLPIPDAGVIFTVNDPAKSEALWTTILGVASMATGKAATPGPVSEVDGVEVRSYQFPPGIEVQLASAGKDLTIALGKRAMSAAVAAKKHGKSIAKDEALNSAVARLNDDTTQAIIVHAGRVAQLAGRFIPAGEMAEIKPVIGLLDKTVVSVTVNHSNERFALSAMISGIPDVSPLVTQALLQEEAKQQQRVELSKAMKSGDPQKALAAIDEQLEKNPGSADLLRAKFKVLATKKKDREAAVACGEKLFDRMKDDANALNTFAWGLVSEEVYGDDYAGLALKFSARSNELTEFKNWAYLDTLAWARFKTGDVEEAIALEKKAIDRCTGNGLDDLNKGLAKFEAALDESKIAAKDKD